MSAICGFVSLDGTPVEARDWQSLLGALSHRGPDGAASWASPRAALGHQMMRVAPDSVSDRQPWHDPAARLTITAAARLDNRGELCALLDVPSAERQQIPGSQLILRAWQKWGEACPERLIGDFAFAIWDEAARRLFCCRDHLGGGALFYFRDGRRFIFASEAKGILAVPGVPKRLNATRLAAMASPEARFGLHEQTFYQDIYSLPAGASLTVDESGARQRTYWTPDEETEWPYASDEEALEAFRALMDEVLRAHTRSLFPIGALLSGGLDSSGVVSVAARARAAEGQTLTTFSAVLPEPSPPGLSDEREFIEQFRGWPNLIMRYITDPGRGPFDDLERITRQAESPLLTSRHYLYTAFAQAAREAGIRVLLNGDWGEQGPTSHADGYYAELFRRWQWRTLARELTQRGKLHQAPVWRLARALVAAPLARHALAQLPARQLASAAREAHVLTPEFMAAHRPALPQPMDDLLTGRYHTLPDHRQNQRRMIWAVYRKHARPPSQFTGYEQVDMRYPFSDRRLLAFCLAAPGRLKAQHGHTRYLIRAGLDGLLPERIQWRTSKMPFSPDYERRYEAQRATAQAVLDDVAPQDPVRAIVDVERVRRLLAQGTAYDAMQIVPTGIYLICFLRQFADFRR
jgi:asparagine synthase (glutamine-hydrolysing)